MKKLLPLALFFCFSFLCAQTSKELLGRWQLVKWTYNGREKIVTITLKLMRYFRFLGMTAGLKALLGTRRIKAHGSCPKTIKSSL